VRKRRKQTPLEEAIQLAHGLGAVNDWIDLDELEYDDDFTRVVALLGDRELIDDETFEEIAVRGAKFLRAGASAAIAEWRAAPT